MKLILINLYPVDTKARYLLSSYVLKAYLDRSFANDNDISIEVLNFSAMTEPSEICDEVIKRSPDCIGYSCYIWNIEKILDIVKGLKKDRDYIHIFGGPEISLNIIKRLPDLALADYYVIGEGERRLENLLMHLKKRSDSKTEVPKGIAYWRKGEIYYKEDSGRITNLDEVPSIYLNEVLDERLYERQQAFLETQRGCRCKCRYCVYHKNLPTISYYSLPRIFEELDYLIIKKRIFALRIFDAVFTSDLARAKEIVRYISEMKKNDDVFLPWIYWEFNYNTIDEEFIKLVASLKYRQKISNTNETAPLNRPQLYFEMPENYTAINCVGIQSFHKAALKAAGRVNIDIEALKDFMNMAKEYNIILKIDVILGLPYETFDTYFEGLEFFLPFFKDTDHVLNIHRLQILPGSDLEGATGAYGIRYSLKAPHIVFSTQSFSEKEMEYASKLNAVLFRVLNSPLRRYFFQAKERTGKSFYGLIEDLFNQIVNSQDLKKSQLVRNEYVYDVYWNDDIFREIPSEWLTGVLKNV